MKVFITGATGYIGSALCRRWAGEGHEIRALVRATSRTRELGDLGVALYEGDIADAASMKEAAEGVDWLVHGAAVVDLERPKSEMERVNVEGSETVAALAYEMGIGRVLSVSSMACFGGSKPDGTPSDETGPIQEPLPTHYSRTKLAGERAMRAWRQRGLAVNTVYPSIVYGPPGKETGANALLKTLLEGEMPVMLGRDRRVSWVHLDDLVGGITRVMERAEPGRDYLLAGDAATVGELAETVCALGGVQPPRIPVPFWLAGSVLALAGPIYRARGLRPPAGPQGLASLRRHWVFDDSRARAELDWAPRSLDEGLPATVDFILG